ncbi:MAG TPA: MFS transporter, partial [bacterium]|nr:MFS transporter [bacterium]
VALWGGIIGMQETVMRASITALAGISRLGIAYGLLNTATGAGALGAGVLAGLLYARARPWLAPVLVIVEMMALLAGVVLVRQRQSCELEKK